MYSVLRLTRVRRSRTRLASFSCFISTQIYEFLDENWILLQDHRRHHRLRHRFDVSNASYMTKRKISQRSV